MDAAALSEPSAVITSGQEEVHRRAQRKRRKIEKDRSGVRPLSVLNLRFLGDLLFQTS
jgi:hypothetical protein